MTVFQNRVVSRRPTIAADLSIVVASIVTAVGFAASVFAALIIVWVSPATAQEGEAAPQILLDDAFDLATKGLAAGAAPPNPGPDDIGTTTTADDSRDVHTGELQSIDPDAVGTLDPADGGFPPDMWTGSSRALIESLLHRLPVATDSASMQSLTRRLLLTRAAVPAGAATVASMLALRVERLLAAGRADDVVKLIGRTTGPADSPGISRARAEALFLAGDSAAACDLSEIMVRESDDLYWLKAAVLCRAKAGDTAGAGLALELLHEQGLEDAGFLSLSAEMITPTAGKTVVVDRLDALRLEILRAMGRSIPAEIGASAEPVVLGALSRDSSLDLDVRLGIAERAETLGAISGDDLGRIYATVAFPPDDIPAAAETAKSSPGPRSNALLYQLATGNRADEERFEALKTLWRLGDTSSGLGTAARVSRNTDKGITPTPDLSWLAPDVLRALLVSGDLDAAMRWYTSLSIEARARLWPLLVVIDRTGVVAPPQQAVPQNAVNAWLRTQSDLVAGQRRERARLAFTLVEAAGHRVPDEYWRELAGEAEGKVSAADPGALRLLESASSGRRVGETVIYALLALGPRGPAHASSHTLAQVFRTLEAVGLPNDARRIAVEAMVRNGL